MSRDQDVAPPDESLRAAYLALSRERDVLAAELARVLQELDGFSYAVAHDLRAPLRAIDGFSRALVADHAEALDDAARGHLERVCAGASRMNTLIEALLDLVRLSRAELHREAVDVSSLAADIVNHLRQAEPSREMAVEIDADLAVFGDRRLLRTLLEHLLGNAWKFTSRTEGARLEMRRRSGEEATFFVRDNGVGFDMAYSQNLFAPFQRLHRAKEFEGTGIGLASAQRIVFRHGGRIWVDAALGSGATVFFTLPKDESNRV